MIVQQRNCTTNLVTTANLTTRIQDLRTAVHNCDTRTAALRWSPAHPEALANVESYPAACICETLVQKIYTCVEGIWCLARLRGRPQYASAHDQRIARGLGFAPSARVFQEECLLLMAASLANQDSVQGGRRHRAMTKTHANHHRVVVRYVNRAMLEGKMR